VPRPSTPLAVIAVVLLLAVPVTLAPAATAAAPFVDTMIWGPGLVPLEKDTAYTGTVRLQGVGLALTRVDILADGVPVYSTFTNSIGTFTFTHRWTTTGTHTLQAVADVAFTFPDESNVITVNIVVPPGAPGELAFAPVENTNEIIISWTPPLDNGGGAVSGYLVYEARSPEGPWTYLGRTLSTRLSFRDTVWYGQDLHYRVAAENLAGIGAPRDGRVEATPPGPPQIVSVEAYSTYKTDPFAGLKRTDHTVVNWTRPTYGGTVQSFRVERAPTPTGPWESRTVVSGWATSYLDTVRPNATTYYRVTTLNVGGSAPSDTASITLTPPAAPTGLSATPETNQVRLTWTPPSNTNGYSIVGYSVQRYNPATTKWAAVADVTGALSYVDTTAPFNATVQYRVTAKTLAGESAPSIPASVLTYGETRVTVDAASFTVCTSSGCRTVLPGHTVSVGGVPYTVTVNLAGEARYRGAPDAGRNLTGSVIQWYDMEGCNPENEYCDVEDSERFATTTGAGGAYTVPVSGFSWPRVTSGYCRTHYHVLQVIAYDWLWSYRDAMFAVC